MHPVKAVNIAMARPILIQPGKADVMRRPKVNAPFCLIFISAKVSLKPFPTPWGVHPIATVGFALPGNPL
jgi:hypothetical protein